MAANVMSLIPMLVIFFAGAAVLRPVGRRDRAGGNVRRVT